MALQPKSISHSEFENKCWRYYLLLENKFKLALNFVEFTDNNFMTYSQEFSMLLLAICMEVESVLKIRFYDTEKNNNNMYHYCKHLRSVFPNIQYISISNYLNEYCVLPYALKEDKQVPEWWSSYNKLKHYRFEKYDIANLKNVYDALAGLFLLPFESISRPRKGSQPLS